MRRFPERDLIIYLTVAVILVTLVFQGLTLPVLVRRLGLGAEEPWAPDEAVARLGDGAGGPRPARRAGVERGAAFPRSQLERLRELYKARFARCVTALSGEGTSIPLENPLQGYRQLRARS